MVYLSLKTCYRAVTRLEMKTAMRPRKRAMLNQSTVDQALLLVEQ